MVELKKEDIESIFFIGLSFCIEIVNFKRVVIHEEFASIYINDNEVLKLPSFRLKIKKDV